MREFEDTSETFDREQRSVSVRCTICRWKFRCAPHQVTRWTCRACESNANAVSERRT
jgi:hypothetical protein